MSQNTQASSSQRMVGFSPEPNCGRGTIIIVWNCLVTIFLCTYTALHLNVPERKRCKGWRLFWWRTRNVLVGILAPELTTVCAYLEWITTTKILQTMTDEGMASATRLEAHFLFMGGIEIQHKRGTIAVRDANANAALEIKKLQQEFPSKDDISDKTKVDFLGKLLTVGQILWFLAQVITRHIQGQAVSLLEVSAISYIVLTAVCYIFWFRKPYGITSKITISIDEHLTIVSDEDDWLSYNYPEKRQWLYISFAILMCAIFSGIHCLAWRYHFPSTQEAWLWRAASLVCFVTGALFMSLELEDMAYWPSSILLGFYILARLALIVLVFMSFRSAPESVYAQVDWTLYISFFG